LTAIQYPLRVIVSAFISVRVFCPFSQENQDPRIINGIVHPEAVCTVKKTSVKLIDTHLNSSLSQNQINHAQHSNIIVINKFKYITFIHKRHKT